MNCYHGKDYVIRFLKGLNKQYAYVRSHIMLLDPSPNISKAFSMLIQQERKLNLPSISDDTIALAFNSGNSGSSSKGGFLAVLIEAEAGTM